ncbi:MAG TPA: TonB-dependent receptor [Verrucomicrobiae bacterium]|jgi:TonB-dependent receptor|nr:TonB-dependent receptor [Verrucomicrobiae bacterium]
MVRTVRFSLLLLATLVCPVLWLTPVTAQVDKGAIAGTVKDTTNAILIGARIEVEPSGKRAVSDSQGQFRINDLVSGDYTLTVSYVGFSPSVTVVKVAGGQTASADALLKVASKADEVLVTAEQVSGEAEAINIERTADNIVQVLPAKVITSLPNTNIADAVGRLPSVTLERDEGEGKYVQIRGTEPRLSNVTINGVLVPSPEGNVRNIKLDVIPSGLVERIEVNKTLSANQDGDAIGGSVNLVTRMAENKPLLDFSGMGGYTPIQGGRTLGNFGGDFGQRFGAKKKFGFMLGGTFDQNNRGIDDLEPTQAIGSFNNQNIALVSSQDLRSYSYYRTRYGFAGGMDYNITDGSNIYVKGLYSDFHDFGDVWVTTPNYGNTIKAVNGSQILFDNAADCAAPGAPANCSAGFMQYRHYIRRPDQQIFSISTGGRHDLKSTLITYEVAGSRSHNVGGQDFPTTHFNGPPVDLAQDLSNPRRPNFKVLDGTNILDPTQYTIADTSLPEQRSTQLNFQGVATVDRRYSLGGHLGTFSMGVLVRNGHKTENENDHFFGSNGNFTLNQVLGTYTNPTYYDHTYQLGPNSDYTKIHQLFLSNQGSFTDNVNQDQIVNNGATFDANERVYAGYVMNSLSFRKVRVQAGLRIEATDATYTANQVNLNNGAFVSAVPVNGSSGYINFLPSVQVQFPIGQNTNLRVAYGRGISRPNFSDIVPTKIIDPNTTPQTLQIGNPALQPTTANNYDLLFEHFFQPLGILQAGFFYKQLYDPIYATVTILPPGDPNAGFRQQESINGPSAHLAGFEAAWEQRLSRLPGFLNGFGVAANYSYTTSQVSFPVGFSGGRIDHPSLQRQAPNTWNLGMTYDRARFSSRFGVSHNDANIFAYQFVHADAATDKDPILGIKGPLGDQYLYAHTQFDVQGSYRFYKGLSFVGYGLNLSNEVFGFYTGSPIYPNQREYYHPTVAVGLRWSSRAE